LIKFQKGQPAIFKYNRRVVRTVLRVSDEERTDIHLFSPFDFTAFGLTDGVLGETGGSEVVSTKNRQISALAFGPFGSAN
jgi:hypothetical protein